MNFLIGQFQFNKEHDGVDIQLFVIFRALVFTKAFYAYPFFFPYVALFETANHTGPLIWKYVTGTDKIRFLTCLFQLEDAEVFREAIRWRLVWLQLATFCHGS